MEIKRYYTANKTSDQTVFDLFKWKKVDVNITDYKTGATLFAAKDIEFPEGYSQSACDIIAKMYFRKSGVPKTEHEVSMKQVAHRMVDFWVAAMIDEGIITTGDDAAVVYDELVYMLLNQMWAPNSPQWFNTGLQRSYGITGEANGLSYYNEELGKVVEADDSYTRTQASACFIVGIQDSLVGEQSLMDNLTTASRLFKYGSGIGSNWSRIRGVGESLSSGGKSSGLLSFQKVFDRNAGAIKSGGTTRRAAVMQVLNIDHPEIMEFVRWKSREEDKVVALGKMGYDISISGDAYETVSGQNVNNSVVIPDEFMEKIQSGDKDATWTLKGRKDASINHDIKANDLWEEIAWAAWRCGDPGVHFSDQINKWNTCPNSGRIEASNPCSEYLFLNDTACNLASINVLKFYSAWSGEFDLHGYIHAISMIQLMLEASIHWGVFPTKQIAENTYMYRTTGLGLTNMGALLMAIGVPYDSDEARAILATLCSIMTGQSYLTSAEMAKAVGPFKEYEKNKKAMLMVIGNHRQAFSGNKPLPFQNKIELVKPLLNEEQMMLANLIWDMAAKKGHKYGYRNAQVTVLAPTGTIAFAMDCDSTSSEPFFSHKTYKKIVDGSFMEMVNQIIPVGLEKLGYNKDQIADIVDYIRNGDGKIEGAPHLKEEHLAVFDTANRCGSGERYLTPMAHVKMVAAMQPHLSGGISKTVNLPADATVEDIKNIYMEAWKLGCKCIALYRDGSKVVQPLTTKKDEVSDPNDISKLNYMELLELTKDLMVKVKEYETRSPIHRERMPFEPKCIKNAVKMDGYTFHIQRSFYDDGRLGEIFATVGKQGDTVKGLMEVLCILISKTLQYGIPADVISEILRNTEFGPNGLVRQHPNIKAASSIPDLISKFIDISIGNYTYCQNKPEHEPVDDTSSSNEKIVTPSGIEGVRVYGKRCTVCGSIHMIKAGTCHYCQDCGASTGCS